MEPIRNDKPKDGFLDKIRAVTKEHDIVLVFDEITAGFRLCCGGSHLTLGIEPDIAVFAKCMANGYPIAAAIGRRDIMSVAEETFISSTFFTERIGFKTALKAIEEHKRIDLHSHLIRIGKKVQDGWKMLADKHGLSIHTGGIYPLSHFQFSENALVLKTYFTQEMLKLGYLATTAFYVSYAHTDEVVDKYLEACDSVFENIKKALADGKKIELLLDGPVCHAGFKRLN
jgi:glutamate-1-semialdehyde aminotransferase